MYADTAVTSLMMSLPKMPMAPYTASMSREGQTEHTAVCLICIRMDVVWHMCALSVDYHLMTLVDGIKSDAKTVRKLLLLKRLLF